MQNNMLPSWNEGPTKQAIIKFVEQVTSAGSVQFVAPEERVAVFDNDGTLWSEKPMPIELGFILERLATMAKTDAALRDRQPWKAAYEKDYHWLGDVITKHYKGDDSEVKVLVGGILKAFEGMSMDTYSEGAEAFLRGGQHPTLKRGLTACGYQPMVELLRYLEHHGFITFIVSGGDRDFMRTVTQDIYGIPPERVVGSSNALCYEENADGGSLVYRAQPEVFDDGPVKPVRIWSRIGRRPIMAVGNSNGDTQMLQFAGGGSRPALPMLILHDDKDREFDYTGGAEHVIDLAKTRGWPIVSMKNDWKTVFAA
ncbi:MAG TPA: HAD family hydrolase [Bryobacteraceae bacterium]|nr:HAD family hydrolase [Bryobacteraceae bacterium]